MVCQEKMEDQMAVFSPGVMAQRIGYMNFNQFGAQWLKKKNLTASELVKPHVVAQIDRDYCALHSILWTYGGWMENRSDVWAETYLKKDARFLHLGVDCSVPHGTQVLAVADGFVIHAGNDRQTWPVGGWGGYVVQLLNLDKAVIAEQYTHALIYAHLGDLQCTRYQAIRKGEKIGLIGTSQRNGGWSPHLHLQLESEIKGIENWQKYMDELDGYGKAEELAYWAKRCPDPTPLIF